jgi:CRISPR-associated endonuclease/helicase Cas3
VILNTKADALAVLDALGNDADALHLSTLLCGGHRMKVLREVARRLTEGEPCRLVATQVVEAGVDLDFPVVYRAFGPLDSIIQAAGRCNRSGRLDRGHVIVFAPETGGMPVGEYRRAATITRGIAEGGGSPHDLDLVSDYYRRLLSVSEPDARDIQKRRAVLDYPEVARRFRIIDDDTVDVIVDYEGRDEQALEAIRLGRPGTRHYLRRLRSHTVAVRRRTVDELTRRGLVAPLLDGVGEWLGAYDSVRGLRLEGYSLDELVV